MFLVDSHCHLDLLDLAKEGNTLQPILARAKEQGVGHILNVSVKLANFAAVLKTAEAYPFVSASVGSHPNERDEEATTEKLVSLGQHKKVVAIGETGLDYFRSTGDLEWQRERFRQHIEAAKHLGKPLIVHTRDAKEDTLTILQQTNASEAGGVMHCFTEDWATAKKALDLGFYISLSGIVTFKNTHHLQEVAQHTPLDRLLIETDSPYLAPTPFRGKPNEPSYVRYTAEHIARLRNLSLDDFAEQTSRNFFNLFRGAENSYV